MIVWIVCVLAGVGAWTAIQFVRYHVRQFRQGVREAACERTEHAFRPWLMKCKSCGCEAMSDPDRLTS